MVCFLVLLFVTLDTLDKCGISAISEIGHSHVAFNFEPTHGLEFRGESRDSFANIVTLVNGFEVDRFDTIIIICYATMFGPLEIFIYVPNWNFNS